MPEIEKATLRRFEKTMEEMDGHYLKLSPTDVAAVKDIRRALRRKYASRSNLPRIFAQWDKGRKGAISVEDLINGIKKTGINMTHE